MQGEKENIIWKQIDPTRLSSACKGQYLVLSKGDFVRHVEAIEGCCVFSTVIIAASINNLSLYDSEIWIGYSAIEALTEVTKPHLINDLLSSSVYAEKKCWLDLVRA